jgi:hypothetical protein
LAQHEKRFPWGLCALLGAIAWVAAVVALGKPILVFLAPAAGVILGWIVGGLVFLLLGALRSLLPHH